MTLRPRREPEPPRPLSCEMLERQSLGSELAKGALCAA